MHDVEGAMRFRHVLKLERQATRSDLSPSASLPIVARGSGRGTSARDEGISIHGELSGEECVFIRWDGKDTGTPFSGFFPQGRL